jgi:hypothetical protein
MTTESKKHHFVPQSILKRFSIDMEEKQIYVFNKQLGKSYISSIIDSGSENKYNTIKTEYGEINLEELYQKVDDLCAVITKKIIDLGTLKGLDLEDFYSIALITANQLKRTKIQRSTLDFVNKELYNNTNQILEKIKNRKLKNSFTRISSEEVKAISIFSSFDLENNIKTLLDKGIYLIKNKSEIPFIISDNPVIMHNSFKYGGTGISEKGIEIYFPISTEYIIGFCCKTLIGKLEQSERIGILQSDGFNLLKSIREDVPFLAKNNEHIEFYNQQQILNSYRFIYSNVNDFSLAHETIEAIPETKNRVSTVKVGEMGKAPPPNKNLPKGELLVVYGANDHNMLPIKVLKQSDVNIIFSSKKNLLLEIILSDTPYERIEFYSNQSLRRLIGQPEINIIDEDKGVFELTHRDKGIIKILENLNNKKTPVNKV